MPVIAVVNRKGGSGKSTLATHIAGYCANNHIPVMLGDVDRQQSTQTWLKLRSAHTRAEHPAIMGWAIDPKNVLRAPAGVSHVILDTPGGMRGFELARVVALADAILMPVCNSVFDRESAADCYAELQALPRVASGLLYLFFLGSTSQLLAQATNIHLTDPVAAAILAGNYNPEDYAPSIFITDPAIIASEINYRISADSLKKYICIVF